MNLRPATEKDYDFVYKVKVDALKEYINATWGWDENQQKDFHKNHFLAKETEIIQFDNQDVGFVVIKFLENQARIEEINIIKKYHNNGIGTKIISDVQTKALKLNLPVWLQVLKVNPAINLYKRLGFTITTENATHFQMQFN